MDSSVYWYGARRPQVQPLNTSLTTGVVVVGGGIAGLTCAHALAARGVDVVLVEDAYCGAGASGKSSGFITPDSELELSDLIANYGAARGQALWEFARSGVERIRGTISALAIDCDYQVQDSLMVASSNWALRRVIALEHRTHAALGYHSTLYDRASLGAVLGSRTYQGGIRYGGTFAMNAFAYCRALRDAIIRQGVRVFEGSRVLRLTPQGVETAGGSVTAPAVAVLTDRYLPALGLATDTVHHIQSFLAISRPLEGHEIRIIFPGDRLMVWDTDIVYKYFRITGEGRLLIGGADLRSMYSEREGGASARVSIVLRRHVSTHFPSLDLELEHLWSGLIGVSPDFAPVAGRHADFPRVYFAGAGAGLPWSAALGAYLADKITSGRAELDEVFSPSRSFLIRGWPLHLMGKAASFAASHGIAKYSRRLRP